MNYLSNIVSTMVSYYKFNIIFDKQSHQLRSITIQNFIVVLHVSALIILCVNKHFITGRMKYNLFDLMISIVKFACANCCASIWKRTAVDGYLYIDRYWILLVCLISLFAADKGLVRFFILLINTWLELL